MTKTVPKKILRIERNFFVNLRKNVLAAHAAPPPIFLERGAPPPTKIDRRAAADTMTSAHSSMSMNSFLLFVNLKYNFIAEGAGIQVNILTDSS